MSKEILVNANPHENRIAVLLNGKLEEYYVERLPAQRLVGSIYKGRVDSILSGIGAAFVGIGLEKNGFLYVDDVIEEGSPFAELLEPEDGDRAAAGPKGRRGDIKISSVLQKGQELMVQIVKEPISTKGARLTAHVSLPGRYLVAMPYEKHIGISKKIRDTKERKRLRDILEKSPYCREAGFIVRTAAEGHREDELLREARYLARLFSRLRAIYKIRKPPALLHEEFGLVQRVARDIFREDFDAMMIDSRDEFRKTLNYLGAISPAMRAKLRLYTGTAPLFVKYNIEDEITRIHERRVLLKGRGYIMIEPTEGLIAIDVNTGGFTSKNPEETAFLTNKEAAYTIMRQLRLRDLGGIIVIDFIDMERREHRDEVHRILREELKKDKAKTNITGFSKLGLVEMTRQRVRDSLESSAFDTCPYCGGRGNVKSMVTIALELQHALERYLSEKRAKRTRIITNPRLKTFLYDNYRKTLTLMGRRTHSKIVLREDPNMKVEDFKIENA